MEEKLKLPYPVVVEGRYDKAKVCQTVESAVLSLEGFSVFHDSEKKALLRRLCEKDGLIILTDSDRAGGFIRAKLKGFLGNGTIYNVYTPCIKGKEKRKSKPSADGLLGVEGIDTETIRRLLLPFASEAAPKCAKISKSRFYEDGLSGRENSGELRAKLANRLSLPTTLTANALLEAINLLCREEEYAEAIKGIRDDI